MIVCSACTHCFGHRVHRTYTGLLTLCMSGCTGRLTSRSCQHSQPRGAPVSSVFNVALTHTSWQQAQQQKHRCVCSHCLSCLLRATPFLLLLLLLSCLLIHITICLCSCGWTASPRLGFTAASSQAAASGLATCRTLLSQPAAPAARECCLAPVLVPTDQPASQSRKPA